MMRIGKTSASDYSRIRRSISRIIVAVVLTLTLLSLINFSLVISSTLPVFANVPQKLDAFFIRPGQSAHASDATSSIYPAPILFVHGIASNAGTWKKAKKHLKKKGLEFGDNINFGRRFFKPKAGDGDFYTMEFSDNQNLTFDEQGQELKKAIDLILKAKKSTATKICLVGHSMGGLAIRSYLAHNGSKNVSGVVTIDSPHIGSLLGMMGDYINKHPDDKQANRIRSLLKTFGGLNLDSKAVMYLNPGSRQILALSKQPLPDDIPYVCLVGRWEPVEKSNLVPELLSHYDRKLHRDYYFYLEDSPYTIASAEVHMKWSDGIVSVWSQYLKSAGTWTTKLDITSIVTGDFHTDATENVKDIDRALKHIREVVDTSRPVPQIPVPSKEEQVFSKSHHVSIVGVNNSKFPFITFKALVKGKDAQYIAGLAREDFALLEDAKEIKDFHVDSLSTAGKASFDIVFVFDTTGSMAGEIEAVKKICLQFAARLQKKNVNLQMGLVTFGDAVRNVFQPVAQPEQFKQWMSGLEADGGGDNKENALSALETAARMPFRVTAQKILILITDAAPHEAVDARGQRVTTHSVNEEFIRLLNASEVVVFCIAKNILQYRMISERTGGVFFELMKDVNKFIEQVSAIVDISASQYTFIYKSNKPAIDETNHGIQVFVHKGAETLAPDTSEEEKTPEETSESEKSTESTAPEPKSSLKIVVVPSLTSVFSLRKSNLVVLIEGPVEKKQVIKKVTAASPVTVIFNGIPDGSYKVRAWHGSSHLTKEIDVRGDTLCTDFVMQ